MNWTWRIPCKFQTSKYTFSNILYYLQYLREVGEIPNHKLKFADEAHVIAKDLTHRKILGIIGKRTYTKVNTPCNASASLTILTTLMEDQPLAIDYREESNTQWDFALFVNYCCREGYLVAGDYLIVDNASIHAGEESYDIIMEILESYGVCLIKLPVYSPELNPCELIFSQLKRYIRNHAKSQEIRKEVLIALSEISHKDILRYYLHCIEPAEILPDFFKI
jgi:transposase